MPGRDFADSPNFATRARCRASTGGAATQAHITSEEDSTDVNTEEAPYQPCLEGKRVCLHALVNQPAQQAMWDGRTVRRFPRPVRRAARW